VVVSKAIWSVQGACLIFIIEETLKGPPHRRHRLALVASGFTPKPVGTRKQQWQVGTSLAIYSG
jgi:hypothetical protein